MINDHCACLALENREKISERNMEILKKNIHILAEWVNQEPFLSYIKPNGGTTALVKYDYNISSRDFCTEILNHTGVLFAPGSTMNMEGWVRIGYANDSRILKEGLALVSRYLSSIKPLET